ncbi:hypothetical protein [Rhizorhabdus dicambivorans]|uniref:hypothetical protein n=1 Tax=Rhizorhabdus dicambivorans TaxID=1850238 RepID=UPI00192D1ACF|nr:hypothetical protein [Rhizorhabdus dicambivorans]
MSAASLPRTVTAAEIARTAGIDPKTFRAALRRANLKWHAHYERWEVPFGSAEHHDMSDVLASLTLSGKPAPTSLPRTRSLQSAPRGSSDETWIIGLCDEVLGEQAIRQHRFPFLTGDPGATGRRSPLPVDAFYPARKLVIEFHEIQHSQPVAHFDKRQTVSGVSRGEQRRHYDELRRKVLPQHGIDIVVFDYSEFEHTTAGRLRRTSRDRQIIAERLHCYAKPRNGD